MRRSKWKGLYIGLESKSLDVLKKIGTLQSPILIPRNSSIVPKFIGLTLKIHNGKSYKKILVTEKMMGHKFGEFAKTRSEFVFKGKKKT